LNLIKNTTQELNQLRKKVNKKIERTGRRQDWISKKANLDKTVLNKLLRDKSKLSVRTQIAWLSKVYKLL